MTMCEKQYHCPLEAALDLVGGKWKALILWYLIGKTMRFREIQACIPQVSHKMLTQQLRDLEKNRLIVRTAYPVVPPKVEYSLSEVGESLIPILQSLCAWGEDYRKKFTQENQSE